jgi:DNA-binding transcriptional LysR family regulator
MTLDLRQIAAFQAVLEHGTLGLAARALNVTQPALSRTVKQMEDRLGVPLFERHVSGMLPTPFGRALERHAALLLRESANAVEEIQALRGLSKGSVKVGAVGSVLARQLPAALSEVLSRSPGLSVQITEAVDEVLAEALVNYEIDLAIGRSIRETDAVVPVADTGWDDEVHIMAAPDHPVRRGTQPLPLAALRGDRWAMPPRGSSPREDLHQLFVQHGVEPPVITIETRSVLAMKAMMVGAGFLTCMPEPLVATEIAAGSLAPLPLDVVLPRRHFFVYRRRQGLLPLPALHLLDELRRQFPR